jgi:16S rRNA (cytosine967-C5)-methyltransferase
MPTAARVLALSLLSGMARERQTLADRFATPRIDALPMVERGFLHELVLGTLRQRGLLDYHLRALIGRPVETLTPPVLADILRLGAHQILNLRVPARAAVNEAVELAAQHAPRAKGLVNAVLRRLARQGAGAVPDAETAPLDWLTSVGSLPLWLAQRWLTALGPQRSVERAAALRRPPPAVFRLNPRVHDAWQQAQAAGLEPEPLVVPGAFRATAGRPSGLAASAVIALQDQGSQLVAHLAAHGNCVFDACAAPGGKAMLIGDLLDPSAMVVAGEVSPRRLSTMRRLVNAWRSPNVRCLGANALTPPVRAQFDTVLVDAPCTGLGTIDCNPDIRWRLQPDDVERHAQSQRKLLTHLLPLVRPGGLLVYSTCSLEEEETLDVAKWLQDAHATLQPAFTPAWVTPFGADGVIRTLPERDGGSAFFAAVFRKQ